MNRPSSLKILWLFARLAVVRMRNGSQVLKQKMSRVPSGGEPPRTGTVARGLQSSRSRRWIGNLFLISMLFGSVLLTTISLVTVVESVRLDDMATAAPITLTEEQFTELSAAASTGNEATRKELLEAALVSISNDFAGTWTKPRAKSLMGQRFAADGIAGFQSVPSSGFRGDLALLSPPARERAIRAVAMYVMLINIGSIGMLLTTAKRSISGSDPVLGWLMQLPVSRRVLSFARFVELTIQNPFALLSMTLIIVPVWQTGASFRQGVLVAIVFGLVTALGTSAVRFLTESFLLGMCGRKLRGTLISFATTAGGLVVLFAYLGSGAPVTTQAIAWIADRVPAMTFWNPWSPGVGTLQGMVEPAGSLLMSGLIAVVMSVVAIVGGEFLTRGDIASDVSGSRGRRNRRSSGPVRSSLLRGMILKEFREMLRQPDILVQILLAPLLILGLIYLKDPARSLQMMTRDGGAVCASIFAVCAYLLLGAATASLSREFKMLGFLQSLPRPLADTVRGKARYWAAIILLPALSVAGWAIATQPDALTQMGLRLPFLIVFIPLIAEICFASVSLAASVPSESSIHFRKSMWLVPSLVSAEAAAALYLGVFWSLFGTLIILLLVNIALRQRLLAELPWISEPSEAPPRRLDAAHALITLGGFLQLRDMLGVLVRGDSRTPETAALIAFTASAVTATLLFLFWKWQSGTRFESRMPRRPALKPLAIGLAVGLAAGLFWVSVLHQSPAVTATANRTLRLPTSLESVDSFAALRLVALLLVAPVFEEWLFRGLLYRSLRRSYHVAASVALSALLFMVIHPIESSVGVLTLAVVTAIVYERTGRISTAIAVHFCYNLAVMGLWTFWPPAA